MKNKLLELLEILFLILLLIIVCASSYYIGKTDIPIQHNTNLDSLNAVLLHKDSIINYKDKQVNILIKSDSIRMNIINKSINQIKNEIKKNSFKTFDVSDSNFQQYIDSLRTKGFSKIQH